MMDAIAIAIVACCYYFLLLNSLEAMSTDKNKPKKQSTLTAGHSFSKTQKGVADKRQGEDFDRLKDEPHFLFLEEVNESSFDISFLDLKETIKTLNDEYAGILKMPSDRTGPNEI
jgi:hypothetical protein